MDRGGASTLAEPRPSATLSLSRFAAWLLSAHNEGLSLKHAGVCQDMTRPLSDYLIASSHNSYLTGHQLRSESSADMYRRQLLMGYRCVELDCWDGADGEPEITHGHTLCTRIKFAEAVAALADSGFVTSPYPLILSLEMHCSWEQQVRIAAILKTVLGERLLAALPLELSAETPLPSPEALRGKVLVKAKRRGRLDALVAGADLSRPHALATADGHESSAAGSDASSGCLQPLPPPPSQQRPSPQMPDERARSSIDSEPDSDGSPRLPLLPSKAFVSSRRSSEVDAATMVNQVAVAGATAYRNPERFTPFRSRINCHVFYWLVYFCCCGIPLPRLPPPPLLDSIATRLRFDLSLDGPRRCQALDTASSLLRRCPRLQPLIAHEV